MDASDSDYAEVLVADPDITVFPASLHSMQDPGQVVVDGLTIENLGVVDLVWNIEEEPVTVALPPMPRLSGEGDIAVASEGRDTPFVKTPDADHPPVMWNVSRAVLYDNGPLVNCPGCGSGGADESQVQTALGLDLYGFGVQVSAGNRLADEFEVPGPGSWYVDTITVFAYQTGSSTTSTITAVNLQIWDGSPDDPASSVVFGDTTTNRMASTGWSNIYRTLDTTSGDTQRAIMANVVTVGTLLPAGTYWVDWTIDGSASFSGPWGPPITIDGQTTTGNGLQYTGTWGPAMDDTFGTFPQGLPFIVEGGSDCMNLAPIDWLSVSPTSGTIAPTGTTPVTVTFDSTGLDWNTHWYGNLCVFSNDPDEPLIVVPVWMEIPIPVELTTITVE